MEGRGMVGGVAPVSMPALHVNAGTNDGSGGSGLQSAVSENWTTGSTETAECSLEGLRCSSSLSNYSGGSSTPWSSYRRRPASSASMTSLHSSHHRSGPSSQQLHHLRLAALNGSTDAVAKILHDGVAVDQTLRQGWTALMYAASSAQVQVLKMLLEEKADPNRHKELFTPLMAACASSVRDSNNNNSTIDATTTTDNSGDGNSNSEGRLQSCVELLLSHGASVNATERHKLTPLMFASKEGRQGLVRVLIRAGALTNVQDNKGWTALCWACHGGHGACARELLQSAADAATCTSHGQTAADIARSQHYYKLAEVVEAAALGSPISAPSLPAVCTPSPPPSSHCTDLDMVLAGLELNNLAPIFHKHKIDLVGFLRLSASELSSLGIGEVGIQHKLLTAIAELHRKAWQPTSVAPLSNTPYISLVDATSMLGNVRKHVTFLEATLGFLRQQLETSPASHHLHHNTTNTTISTLISTAEDADTAITRLQQTTRFLARHLYQLSECSSHVPADLIVCRGPDRPRVWRRAVCSAAVATAFLLTALSVLKPPLLATLFVLAPQGDTVILDCSC